MWPVNRGPKTTPGKVGVAVIVAGLFGSIVLEMLLHAALGWWRHIPGSYDDERIN